LQGLSRCRRTPSRTSRRVTGSLWDDVPPAPRQALRKGKFSRLMTRGVTANPGSSALDPGGVFRVRARAPA
jgi:hypothetical protein